MVRASTHPTVLPQLDHQSLLRPTGATREEGEQSQSDRSRIARGRPMGVPRYSEQVSMYLPAQTHALRTQGVRTDIAEALGVLDRNKIAQLLKD